MLTYHSLNVTRNTYEGNDHLAFASDLRTIHELGMRILPLGRVVDWLEGKISWKEIRGGVALTLDDGSWLDFHDIVHPDCGHQASMLNLLKAFRHEVGETDHNLHVSSFVIASPEARVELDRKILIGKGWWGDDWWAEAQSSRLMSIECHSWDHVHGALDEVAQKDNIKADFTAVATHAECAVQVTRAAEYIEQTANSRPSFMAYPWGQYSDYLVNEFMPEDRLSHRLRAAFSIEPRHVTRDENIWCLPRYVCGRDWKTPAELVSILRDEA